MASSVFKNIAATKELGKLEIESGISGNRSWHHQYRHSAYIYIGGLKDGMTEGDVIVVFSQFGEIADCHMVRDKKTGKGKGFCFICYEDQRSTDLAVDNMNGYVLLGRTLRVDHVEKFKVPKKFEEDENGEQILDENGDPILKTYEATGTEGKGIGEYNHLDSTKKINEVTKLRDEKIRRDTHIEDADESWAKAFEQSLLQQKSGKEQKKLEKKLQKREKKKAKREKKKAKKEAKKEAKMQAKKGAKKENESQKKGSKAKAESSSTSSDDDDSSDSEEEVKSPPRDSGGRRRSPPKDRNGRGRSPSRERGGRRRDDSRKRARR